MGMMIWKPIETALPVYKYILITDGIHTPDIVTWRDKVPEHTYLSTKYLARPAGWFSVNGGRSRVISPKYWMELPECLKE